MIRHALAFFAAVLFAVVLFAAPPEAWYTPSEKDYQMREYLDGWASITTARGTVEEVDFQLRVDENGQIVDSSLKDALGGLKLSVNSAIDLIDMTLNETAQSILEIERLDAQFVALGKNLNKVMSIDGMKININGRSYTLGINKSTLEGAIKSGSTVEYTDEDGLFSVADEKSLINNKGVLGIKNWGLPESGSFWDMNAGSVMIRPAVNSTAGPAYFKYAGIDKLSLNTDSSGRLQLSGWSKGDNSIMTPLGDVLAGGSGYLVFDDYSLVVRTKSGGVNYVKVGRLAAGAASDESSIVTNSSGKMALKGWDDASGSFDYPRKSGEGHLEWVPIGDMADSKSIRALPSDSDAAPTLEVYGASDYAGKHANHYFGTSKRDAELGWHELPNVTTNAVSGDEVTISSTMRNNEKVFGLKGWPRGGREPLFLANCGGALEYRPIYFPTNGAACGCTNKWESLAEWIPDTSHDGDHFTPPESDISAYLKTKGFVYGDEGEDLNFSGGKASFNAPENWADDVTLTVRDGKFALKNFADGACGANLNDMLTNTTANCADRGNHQILCRYTKGGNTLHWLPFPNDPLKTGGEGDGWTGSFSYRNGRIQDGCVMIGRTPVRVSGMDATDGEYRITVDIGSKTATLGTGSGFSAPQGTISYIPVFVLSDGKITADYRGSFVVQAWE